MLHRDLVPRGCGFCSGSSCVSLCGFYSNIPCMCVRVPFWLLLPECVGSVPAILACGGSFLGRPACGVGSPVCSPVLCGFPLGVPASQLPSEDVQ